MKKLLCAFLAASAMTAAVASESKTGAYVGGNVGMGNTNAKYDFKITNANGSAVGTNNVSANNFKADSGKMNALFGLFAGYGMQVGSMYFGGEVFGGLDSSKVNPYDDSASGSSISYFKTEVKRQNFYGLAARLGAFVNPSTMIYVRLAAEAGKWTASAQSVGGTVASGSTAALLAASQVRVSSTKKTISFAPGLGLEAYLTKNLFLRAEYSYLFGPSVTVKQTGQGANGNFLGDTVTHNFKITQNVFKVGVGYKF